MPMIDFFGVSFSKAKSDLEKNIGRIKERYESDPKRFTVVQRMLAAEFDVRDDDQLATKGVRWIKRSMEFTKELLLNIQQGLSLSQAANAAYDLTLVKYHNWFIQKIFRVGFATLGNRQDLIVKMSYHPEFAGEPEFEKVLYEDMDKYLDDLQKTLDIIKKFFDKYDIEN
ncbi:glycolipid transfer protein-like [Glandiceps talaboti]